MRVGCAGWAGAPDGVPLLKALPTNRKDAQKAGAKRYWTGEACPFGHTSWRYTRNGTCVDCDTARRNEKYYQKSVARVGRPMPCYCEACGAPGPLNMDHDHETGKGRGWLCHHCNLALGHVKDSPQRLRQLAKYLEATAESGLAESLGLRRRM